MKRLECELTCTIKVISGLVHSYLAFGKTKEALYTAREAMNAMPQSAKALKLVGDVHASTSSGREKVNNSRLYYCSLDFHYINILPRVFTP